MWEFKLLLCPYDFLQIRQLTGFKMSCTVCMWEFKWNLWPNDFLQIKHLNGFKFSCTVCMWVFKWNFWPNDFLQIKHVNGLLFSWTVLICTFKLLLTPNDFLQIKQLNCRSFPWTVFICIFKYGCLNDLLQIRHSNLFICLWIFLESSIFKTVTSLIQKYVCPFRGFLITSSTQSVFVTNTLSLRYY